MSMFESAFSFAEEIGKTNRQEILLELIAEHESILKNVGLPVKTSSQATIDVFNSFPDERQARILANLRFHNKALAGASSELTSGLNAASQFTREKEIPYLMTALRKAGLRLGDSSILGFIEDDDLIEIFDSQGVQLYRSWSCYKYCVYSLAELLIYDWDTLYIRPSWVAKKLYEMVPLVFQGGVGTIPFNFPEYAMTERLMKNDRVLMFQMKYVSPLLCEDTRRTLACICTGKITSIQKSNPANQIHMI